VVVRIEDGAQVEKEQSDYLRMAVSFAEDLIRFYSKSPPEEIDTHQWSQDGYEQFSGELDVLYEKLK